MLVVRIECTSNYRGVAPRRRITPLKTTIKLKDSLMRRHVSVLALAAACGGTVAQPRICVPAVHNAEFESSPRNYAHWLLAHAMPLAARLAERAAPARRPPAAVLTAKRSHDRPPRSQPRVSAR